MSRICLSLFLLLAWSSRAAAGILKLDLDDVIHPITAEYVVQGIAQAEAEQSVAVILRLSTPGGLDPSMRHLSRRFSPAQFRLSYSSVPAEFALPQRDSSFCSPRIWP